MSGAKDEILNILRQIETGSISLKQALEKLRILHNSELGYAKADHHRSLSQGVSEIIYGAGKTKEQIFSITDNMRSNGARNILFIRIPQDVVDYLTSRGLPLDYYPIPNYSIT